jgi:hypothetical protein
MQAFLSPLGTDLAAFPAFLTAFPEVLGGILNWGNFKITITKDCLLLLQLTI